MWKNAQAQLVSEFRQLQRAPECSRNLCQPPVGEAWNASLHKGGPVTHVSAPVPRGRLHKQTAGESLTALFQHPLLPRRVQEHTAGQRAFSCPSAFSPALGAMVTGSGDRSRALVPPTRTEPQPTAARRWKQHPAKGWGLNSGTWRLHFYRHSLPHWREVLLWVWMHVVQNINSTAFEISGRGCDVVQPLCGICTEYCYCIMYHLSSEDY